MYKVDQVILPTNTGLIGIFDNHTPLLSGLEPGLVKFKMKEKENWSGLVISPGVLLVQKNYTFSLSDEKKKYIFSSDPEKEKEYLPEPGETCVLLFVKNAEFIENINPISALAEFTEAQVKLASANTKKERLQAQYDEKLTRARYKITQLINISGSNE